VLRNGFASGANNTAPESFVMTQALQQGIAVVVPDYEGPQSEFLSGLGEGRMVIDGIRAARRFAPAGLKGSPVGIWGYSGGAYATSIAGQIQPNYAPRVKLAAMVLGGVPADLQSTILSFDKLRLGGILAMGFSSVARSYPGQHLETYLNDTGRAALQEAGKDCIADAALRRIGQGFSDFESTPDAIHVPAVANFLRRISPLGIPGTPATPVYDYHAVLDELAPIGPDQELVARYCGAGVKVQHVEDRLSEHISLVASGAPGVITYLTDRFNGVPAPSTC
jgi:acetyl esterase/lipase